MSRLARTAAVAAMLAMLAGCASPGASRTSTGNAWVRNMGAASGYSISFVAATPEPGTTLAAGKRVEVTVTVKYTLDVTDTGKIVMVFQDQGEHLIGRGPQVATPVQKGSGQVTLSGSVVPPPGTTEVHLYLPLAPKGYTTTDGELQVRYPVKG